MTNTKSPKHFNIKITDFLLDESTTIVNVETDNFTLHIKTYEATIIINNQVTNVSFDPENLESINVSIDSMCEFISEQLNWISANENLIKSKIVEDLFTLAEEWHPDNENPLTKQSFKNQLELCSIWFYSLDECNIDYNVGDVFADHGANLSLSSDKVLSEAQME